MSEETDAMIREKVDAAIAKALGPMPLNANANYLAGFHRGFEFGVRRMRKRVEALEKSRIRLYQSGGYHPSGTKEEQALILRSWIEAHKDVLESAPSLESEGEHHDKRFGLGEWEP